MFRTLLLAIVLVALICFLIWFAYKMYRTVRRENDADIIEIQTHTQKLKDVLDEAERKTRNKK